MVKRYLDTVTREEALAKVLETARLIEDEELVSVTEAPGRITSRPLAARLSNPPFTCSAMDGYAVDYEKTLAADLEHPVPLAKERDAARVNTGDPLPQGTNSVIMIEETEDREGSIVIRKSAYLWQHVRLVGEDLIEGDILFPSNYRVRLLDVGVIIGTGTSGVWVRKKPSLVVIPTGKELVDIVEQPTASLAPGQLIDFNSYTLVALASDLGFDARRLPVARSSHELQAAVREHAGACHVIVINAGSSAGTEDFTESVIREEGELLFHGVRMMPGKPTLFGTSKSTAIFGIPGYPVSAVVSFRTFLEPLHHRLTGLGRGARRVTCITPYKIASSIGAEEVLRMNLTRKGGRWYAFALPRGASLFSSMAKADAILRVPENVEGYLEGEEVSCELLAEEEEILHRIAIIGSHDLSLDIIRDMVKRTNPAMDLVSTHVGSLSGIMAVRKGIVEACTTHILDEKEKIYNIPAIKTYLPGRKVRLVHIAKRIQGLLVAKGNPKGIEGLADLARPDVTFVNRQVGSGTRILLDSMLQEAGIDRRRIRGYDREESTHAAVGVLVKEGVADTGVAIYPISRIFSLDFVPLMEEEYDLLVTDEFTGDERFKVLMEILLSEEFKRRLSALGGYITAETGKVKYVNG